MKRVWVWMVIVCLVLTGCQGMEPAWRKIPGISSENGAEEEKEETTQQAQTQTEEAGTKESLSLNIPETSESAESLEETDADEMESQDNESDERTDKSNRNDDSSEVIESRIAIATDIHYLEKSLTDNGKSFQAMVQNGDGMMIQYCWEIMMAFLEQIEKEKPDVLVLSGDLTKNGEKKSHEALAERLRRLENAGIPVVVIPGNHDINSPYACGFRGDETYSVQQISAKQFAQIYNDFGYKEAISRDPYSLSYVYSLNEYTWLLMLDSCQYEPKNLVGGMIREETYDWIEENLKIAWEEGVRVIPISHHNLLEQTNASEEFIKNCTIEHDERLIELWEGNQINIHLSGHLHLQHYKQTESEQPLYEVVTGSLMMYPCKYGILEVMNSGDMYYYTQKVPVAEWAAKYKKNDRNLLTFDSYAEQFLYDLSYRKVYESLQNHGISKEDSDKMAKLYARLTPNFYAGTIPNEREEILSDPAYELWKESEYFSEVSTTIQTVIEEENHNFNRLFVPY